MSEIAYVNGEYLPAARAQLAFTDGGFVQGVTLAEQLRTFRGRLFQKDAHLDRLMAGLRHLEWDRMVTRQELAEALEQVAAANYRQLDPADDLGVAVFVTPGTYSTYLTAAQLSAHGPARCFVGVHSYPLPFRLWQQWYEVGQELCTVSTRQVPAACWPAELKCRSRMHYYLAAQEARRRNPRAAALLQDLQGNISETPTANVVAFFQQVGLVSPPQQTILPGISLNVVRELAAQAGVPFQEQVLDLDRLREADEVLLTSTPFCLLPVAAVDERRWPNAQQGTMYRLLLERWAQLVGLDFAAQAAAFADR